MVGAAAVSLARRRRASQRERFLREPAELLMTTPESLEVMLISPRVPMRCSFRDLRCVVIDEVHAIAGTDRGAHPMSVLERLARSTQHDVQRVGLSATVGNPERSCVGFRAVARDGRRRGPAQAKAGRGSSRSHRARPPGLRACGRAGAGEKEPLLLRVRSLTEAVADRMRGHGIDVFVHHSSVSKEERELAEESFHEGRCPHRLHIDAGARHRRGRSGQRLQAERADTVFVLLAADGPHRAPRGQVANTTFF